MAGQLLQVLIRLNKKKYHRMQIAARFRLIDLLKEISKELNISIDQLIRISIYRRSANNCTLIYPVNNLYANVSYDASIPLESYGLSNGEEIYIDLSDLSSYDDESENEDQQEKSKASSSMTSTSVSTQTKNISQDSLSSLGQLNRYIVPSDNSCLFTSIYFVLHSGKIDLSSNKYLRNLVAKRIESDHFTYSEAVLGKTNPDYCKWIRQDDSWGGGIELAILTQEYEVEICVLNTQSGGRIDYFGEDRHFPYRVFLLYDDLHYDPVFLVRYDVVEQKEFVQTKFHRTDDEILSLAKNLVQIEQSNLTKSSK